MVTIVDKFVWFIEEKIIGFLSVRQESVWDVTCTCEECTDPIGSTGYPMNPHLFKSEVSWLTLEHIYILKLLLKWSKSINGVSEFKNVVW